MAQLTQRKRMHVRRQIVSFLPFWWHMVMVELKTKFRWDGHLLQWFVRLLVTWKKYKQLCWSTGIKKNQRNGFGSSDRLPLALLHSLFPWYTLQVEVVLNSYVFSQNSRGAKVCRFLDLPSFYIFIKNKCPFQ